MKSFLLSISVFVCLTAMNAQVQVIVPDDIISSELAVANLPGWRMLATGNSTIELVEVANLGISENFGAHSIRASRLGGQGNNRSFLGYYEFGRTLSSLSDFSWNRFSEEGNDSYLNIFITNGTQVATIVYQPTITQNTWQSFRFNQESTSGISIRISGTTTSISYANLMETYGSWTIYNHPNGMFADFIGGIVLVSGSSSPTLPQRHVFDGVRVSFAGEAQINFDFVAPEVEPPVETCVAAQVVNFVQGKQSDGSDVAVGLSDPNNALQTPENPNSDDANHYVSLGFGGSITLKMSGEILNGPGNDIRVFESTFGSGANNCRRWPEEIQAFASQDGCNWTYLGRGCQDAEFDLGPLNWALYLRFVDVSNIGSSFGNTIENGYDLDGVVCLNGFDENPVEQDFGAFYASEVVSFNQGPRKNGTPVAQNRSNPNQALNQPENDFTINFVSLGFGGRITLKMGYVIFDKPGIDLEIVETTFNNTSCAAYPETAEIEVSLDNQTYTFLGVICQDGTFDFSEAGVTAAQFIRISDRSKQTAFGSSADGYDVDGLIASQPGCPNTTGPILPPSGKFAGQELLSEETGLVEVYPNPFNDLVNFGIETASLEERVIVRVMNVTGQEVFKTTIEAAANSVFTKSVDLSQLVNGIYLISVETSNGRDLHRVIKQ